MIDEIKKDAEGRMAKSIEALKSELSKLRTGRANTSILDHVTVDYYGSQVPLSQVATVTAADARMLTVSPWEKDMVAKVEKAIMTSDLGLNPATSGTLIRVPMPPLTEERRKDMTKVVKQEGENARIAIRNIRRDANNDFKSLNKDKEITDDQLHQVEDDIQKLTDKYVKQVDALIEQKEKDLMEL